MPKKEFLVTADAGVGERLDVFLAGKIKELARSQVQKLIDKNLALVNGRSAKPGYRLRAMDHVEVEYEGEEPGPPVPEDIPVEVLYRDDHIFIVNKPAGMIVHPGAGVRSGTLVNALLFRFPEIRGVGPEDRPGIVHRLDKDTSGVMVAARSVKAYDDLLRQFKNREVEKTYLCLVWGRMPEKEGLISWAIGRHAKHRQRISVKTKKPKEALTFFKVKEEYGEGSLLEVRPRTGRTHQIRVHFAASGHPVVGDRRYGRSVSKVRPARLFLHSHRLAFFHPATGQKVEFSVPLPPEFEEILR